MTVLLAFWSHALAALTFGSLLMWQLRAGVRATGQKVLLGALLLTLSWAWLTAVAPLSVSAHHAETARNLLWIGLLHSLAVSGRDEGGGRLHGVGWVYAAVSAVLALQCVIDQLAFLSGGRTGAALATAAVLLRATAAAGALVLVHNLYGQAAPGSRSSIRLVMVALAGLWLYDLNLYTVAFWQGGVAGVLYDGRGAAVTLLTPLIALGAQRIEGWRLKLSRAATFQSLGLAAVCSYFAVMAVLATALRGTDWGVLKSAALVLLAAMTVAAVAVLPSARLRGRLRVTVAKHLFEHRYDYRTEWLRVADTLGRTSADAPPLAERVIRALADIVDAPSGLLLTQDTAGISWNGQWRWAGPLPALGHPDALAALWAAMAESGDRVLEFSAAARSRDGAADAALPAEWRADERLWVAVPLLHGQRVVGLVLLWPPEDRRPLDWEDYDVLRTAARQAASTLAEAHGQQALTTARAFEDFNRRFAFILHDVKNLVSQLSLLTRNAERHADNPEFRADMIATLKGSVGKLNDLLTRLAPTSGGGLREEPVPFPLRTILAAAVASRRGQHEVQLLGPTGLIVRGDPRGLEQAVDHLLGNAVDASPAEEPVVVRVAAAGERVEIEIVDRGCGMDPEFVRQRLFQPFASTKPGGFGIGAYEARSLVEAMGGALTVDSRPGAGSRFTITLPAAPPVESISA